MDINNSKLLPLKSVDFIKNWLSLIPNHGKEIDYYTNQFVESYVKEYGDRNEFDLIEVYNFVKLSYCLGYKHGIENNIKNEDY